MNTMLDASTVRLWHSIKQQEGGFPADSFAYALATLLGKADRTDASGAPERATRLPRCTKLNKWSRSGKKEVSKGLRNALSPKVATRCLVRISIMQVVNEWLSPHPCVLSAANNMYTVSVMRSMLPCR